MSRCGPGPRRAWRSGRRRSGSSASPNFTGAGRNGAVYLKWAVGPDPTVKGTGAKFPADEVGLLVFRDWLMEQGYEVETKRGEGSLKSETVAYVWVYVRA